jgi:hypothetical protein
VIGRRRTIEKDAFGSFAPTATRGRLSACCESLAGRTDDAFEHLRQAIDMWDGCRDMAEEDSDFDPVRDEPAFQDLIGRRA